MSITVDHQDFKGVHMEPIGMLHAGEKKIVNLEIELQQPGIMKKLLNLKIDGAT